MHRTGHMFASVTRHVRVTLLAGALMALGATRATAQSPSAATDWANLARYREANAALGPPAAGENRVVFYGNSITEGWARLFPELFPGEAIHRKGDRRPDHAAAARAVPAGRGGAEAEGRGDPGGDERHRGEHGAVF